MITFTDIKKTYGNRTVLNGIDLHIDQGEFVSITGPSGAGKTSLASILIGHLKPSSGSLVIDKHHIEDMDEDTRQMYRRKIGVVFQDYKLLPQKTVYENVAFALEVCGTKQETIEKRVPKILDLVGLMKVQNNFPHELSGGEQQRTAVARALVHEPGLLIADEPTGNLDSRTAKSIIDLIKHIHKQGTTVILTTHNMEIIKYVDSRVVILDQGEVMYDGPYEDVGKKNKA